MEIVLLDRHNFSRESLETFSREQVVKTYTDGAAGRCSWFSTPLPRPGRRSGRTKRPGKSWPGTTSPTGLWKTGAWSES